MESITKEESQLRIARFFVIAVAINVVGFSAYGLKLNEHIILKDFSFIIATTFAIYYITACGLSVVFIANMFNDDKVLVVNKKIMIPVLNIFYFYAIFYKSLDKSLIKFYIGIIKFFIGLVFGILISPYIVYYYFKNK